MCWPQAARSPTAALTPTLGLLIASQHHAADPMSIKSLPRQPSRTNHCEFRFGIYHRRDPHVALLSCYSIQADHDWTLNFQVHLCSCFHCLSPLDSPCEHRSLRHHPTLQAKQIEWILSWGLPDCLGSRRDHFLYRSLPSPQTSSPESCNAS